jgi:hypothetical protein
MAEITEFDKSKERYKKKYSKYVKVADRPVPEKLSPKSGITVVITDSNKTHTFEFDMPWLEGNRSPSLRTKQAYERSVCEFVKQEFGKWQSLQIR